MVDRRSFLGLLGGALVADRVNPILRALDDDGAPDRKVGKVGIQLYTLRGEMRRDLPGTLSRLARIGYGEVEFAGYFDHIPAELRTILERNRLGAPSTHVELGKTRDAWERTCADAEALGCTYWTVPWIDEGDRRSIDDYKRVAERFNDAARVARASGLRFAYHNHDFELRPVGGEVPLDVLLAETDPSLVSFEMDVYWVVKGGGDPAAFLQRHPGRFTMLHAKDATAAPELNMTEVGRGTIDFARLLSLAGARAVEHVFVEHDNPGHAWESVTTSYHALSRIIS